MLTGKCLCGDCSYEIDGVPAVVAHCCCLNCQRTTGAGHSTGAMFPEENVRLTGTFSSFSMPSEAGNTVTRLFCRKCGSPLFGKNTGMPGFMTVSLGTLDVSDELKPQVVIFAKMRRTWDAIDGSLPAYDDQPAWKPGQ